MNLISFFPAKKPVVSNDLFDFAFDRFFRDDFPAAFNGNGFLKTPAINIAENAGGYRIEVAAPGLVKEDFSVKVDGNLLTISAKKEAAKTEGEKYTSREFSYLKFNRTFTLPETVDAKEGISANYENGILNVSLAKKIEAKPESAKVIQVA